MNSNQWAEKEVEALRNKHADPSQLFYIQSHDKTYSAAFMGAVPGSIPGHYFINVVKLDLMKLNGPCSIVDSHGHPQPAEARSVDGRVEIEAIAEN